MRKQRFLRASILRVLLVRDRARTSASFVTRSPRYISNKALSGEFSAHFLRRNARPRDSKTFERTTRTAELKERSWPSPLWPNSYGDRCLKFSYTFRPLPLLAEVGWQLSSDIENLASALSASQERNLDRPPVIRQNCNKVSRTRERRVRVCVVRDCPVPAGREIIRGSSKRLNRHHRSPKSLANRCHESFENASDVSLALALIYVFRPPSSGSSLMVTIPQFFPDVTSEWIS
jgi:hypothetical protein